MPREAEGHRLVDPETGETPPLSPRRLTVRELDDASGYTQALRETLQRVVAPSLKAYLEGSWDEVTEPDDAA